MPSTGRLIVPALALLTVLGGLAPAGADLVGTAAAPGPSPPAWGPVATAKIRPGAEASTSEGGCTYNFLFYDSSNAYIGTAGHCTDKINDRVSLPGVGQIGTVVFDSDVTPGANAAVDFTLVRLDASRVSQANPEMLGFHAPTGVAPRSDLVVGDQLSLYGYGLVLGETGPTRPRTGVLVGTTPTMYRADLPAVNGDSGAPLIETSSGLAVGIISHYGIGIPPTTDEGPLMTFVLSELAKANFNVQLATV